MHRLICGQNQRLIRKKIKMMFIRKVHDFFALNHRNGNGFAKLKLDGKTFLVGFKEIEFGV
jgi:hypothetical protein